MESVWDYVMRRKPIFLGYFALFLISCFASCQLLNNLISASISETPKGPGVIQEAPSETLRYRDYILSPQAVANLSSAVPALSTVPDESLSTPPTFVHVAVVNPPLVADDQENSSDSENQQLATVDKTDQMTQPSVEVPLTGSPRKISIFRTILAVLLAVTSLTLAGFGLYQSYEYFRPLVQKALHQK